MSKLSEYLLPIVAATGIATAAGCTNNYTTIYEADNDEQSDSGVAPADKETTSLCDKQVDERLSAGREFILDVLAEAEHVLENHDYLRGIMIPEGNMFLAINPEDVDDLESTLTCNGELPDGTSATLEMVNGNFDSGQYGTLGATIGLNLLRSNQTNDRISFGPDSMQLVRFITTAEDSIHILGHEFEGVTYNSFMDSFNGVNLRGANVDTTELHLVTRCLFETAQRIMDRHGIPYEEE